MPLLGNGEYRELLETDKYKDATDAAHRASASLPQRSQSQHSRVAKTAIMSNVPSQNGHTRRTSKDKEIAKDDHLEMKALALDDRLSAPVNGRRKTISNGFALSDTPATTAPNSPIIPPRRQNSGSSVRLRPTTLDIPGLTKSKVSPDGKIAQRDVGSKLVIVMVGLPARGKSYVTKKVARYLNWLQHDTKIFNVGARRRMAAAGTQNASLSHDRRDTPSKSYDSMGADRRASISEKRAPRKTLTPPPSPSTQIQVNGKFLAGDTFLEALPPPLIGDSSPEHKIVEGTDESEAGEISGGAGEHKGHATAQLEMPPPPLPRSQSMEQTASFFDPDNERAARIREEVAMETLDELLDYILDQGGSVGIFDATNSTLERRKAIIEKVRQRAGPELGILFLESLCIDENLLESNMRLKLSGPDYRDQDPVVALKDFKKRVALYEKKYVPLGEYEEANNMPYVQMIDVGRKVVSHQIRGFLSAQTVYYLLNFNLAPRQIWITRHGESLDNVNGKIGGDSGLSEAGHAYAKALTRFIQEERKAWDVHQHDKALSTHFPPRPGDTTPPNPEYGVHDEDDDCVSTRPFCVWTSMLKRSVETGQYFDEDDFDVKQMKMLDELNAGTMEGLTYEEIKTRYSAEYQLRKSDKLHYRYPGAGGEGYLDVINRLRAVIVEAERMTDHLLFVGHRSVARVLLAYFKGLKREDVADLDVPLGMLYMLEPKPYGVDFRAYRYNPSTDWFDFVPNYELRRANSQSSV